MNSYQSYPSVLLMKSIHVEGFKEENQMNKISNPT